MKEFKTRKNLVTAPELLGLSLQFFFIFLGVLVVTLFSLIGSFNMLKLFAIITIDVVAYFGLKFLGGEGFDNLGKTKFPDSITTDNF